MSYQIPPRQARAHAYRPECYGCGEPEDSDNWCVEVWVSHVYVERPIIEAAWDAQYHDEETQLRSHALALRVPFWVMTDRTHPPKVNGDDHAR